MRSSSSGSVKVFWPRHRRDELIDLLHRSMPALAAVLPVTRAVLFGSWARGRATAFSDVDVLIVYADPPRPDAFAQVRQAIDLPGLEPHVYAASEADAVAPTIERMTRDAVILLPATPS